MMHPLIKLAILLTLSTIEMSCIMGCGGSSASRLPPSIARPFTMEQLAQQKRNRLCTLHNQPLREDRVVVRYGLPDEHYINAIDVRFPHSDSVAFGFCGGGEPRVVEVLYCQQCRAAEQAWRAVWYGDHRGE